MGAYRLQPPDARAIFLHNDLLCNDTCSVTGGEHNLLGGGAQTERSKGRIPSFRLAGGPVKTSNLVTDLGVVVNTSLTWSEHLGN